MNRDWTNRIRFVLDELIPPLLRDSRWFMWLFFVLAYRRWSVGDVMDFKVRAYGMSNDEYAAFYAELGQSLSRRRATDLNGACLQFLGQWVQNQTQRVSSILDVGTGNGFLLMYLRQKNPQLELMGVDVAPPSGEISQFKARVGMLPTLPFDDKIADLVTCTHVLEHVPDLESSIRELLRLSRDTLIVVVPRQRFYRYTLDEHLNFFPEPELLLTMLGRSRTEVHLLDGDWLFVVNCRSVISPPAVQSKVGSLLPPGNPDKAVVHVPEQRTTS